MSVSAKICGVTTPEAVRAALDGGAAYLGFMFFAACPRNLGIEAAARLAEPVRGRAKIVAIAVDPSDAELDRIAAVQKPDFIQLHGRETPSRVREAAVRSGAAVIKAVAVGEAADLDAAASYETVAEHLMFDARAPKGATQSGGTGSVSGTWPRRCSSRARSLWTFPLAWSAVPA
jgi:phosphoribosylanthranilate isomerase